MQSSHPSDVDPSLLSTAAPKEEGTRDAAVHVWRYLSDTAATPPRLQGRRVATFASRLIRVVRPHVSAVVLLDKVRTLEDRPAVNGRSKKGGVECPRRSQSLGGVTPDLRASLDTPLFYCESIFSGPDLVKQHSSTIPDRKTIRAAGPPSSTDQDGGIPPALRANKVATRRPWSRGGVAAVSLR